MKKIILLLTYFALSLKENSEARRADAIKRDEEKKRREEIREIREKLMKFLTRIPIFMYLTDEREKTVLDIVSEVNPDAFKEVTGITIPEFERIYANGLFN